MSRPTASRLTDRDLRRELSEYHERYPRLAARRALLRSSSSLTELGARIALDPADVSRILHGTTFGAARRVKVDLLVRVLGLDPSVEIVRVS
jgi:hypothetical protein